MIHRIHKRSRRLVRLVRKAARGGLKALHRLWRYHQRLLATEPGYRHVLRTAATFLLGLVALPRLVSAAVLAVLEHHLATPAPSPSALPY